VAIPTSAPVNMTTTMAPRVRNKSERFTASNLLLRMLYHGASPLKDSG
jgi:hypothetical protein